MTTITDPLTLPLLFSPIMLPGQVDADFLNTAATKLELVDGTDVIFLDDLAGTSEVATLLGCPKQQIHALRKNPKFPQPVASLAATPIWRQSDILSFKEGWKRRAKRITDVPAV